MESVELRPAYAWDCPSCGREMFARAIVMEMSEEDGRQIRDDMFGDPEDPGCFVQVPESVTCTACGEIYRAGLYNVPETPDD